MTSVRAFSGSFPNLITVSERSKRKREREREREQREQK